MRRDAGRAAGVLAVSTAIALLANALSARPVPLFAPDGPGAWPERAPRISAEELRAAEPQGLVLVDVRPEEDFRARHPARAVSAPYGRFTERYPDLAPLFHSASRIVVLCEGDECPSADRVAKILQAVHPVEIRVLKGGWAAYRAAGLETAP